MDEAFMLSRRRVAALELGAGLRVVFGVVIGDGFIPCAMSST